MNFSLFSSLADLNTLYHLLINAEEYRGDGLLYMNALAKALTVKRILVLPHSELSLILLITPANLHSTHIQNLFLYGLVFVRNLYLFSFSKN